MADSHGERALRAAAGGPFPACSDPRLFFPGRDYRSCLGRVWDGIDQRQGLSIVLGPPGVGKTTLMRKIAATMHAMPDEYCVAEIETPLVTWSTDDLLDAILRAVNTGPAPTPSQRLDHLHDTLIAREPRTTSLLIGDAHNLNKRGQLELLRLIQNFERGRGKLLNVLLFANEDWDRVLFAAPAFTSCAGLVYTLAGLDSEEIPEFLMDRIDSASCDPPIDITPDGIEALVRYAGVNPGALIRLCRNAYAMARRMGLELWDEELIDHAFATTTLVAPRPRQRIPEPITAPTTREANIVPLRPAANQSAPAPLAGGGSNGSKREARANALLLNVARSRQ